MKNRLVLESGTEPFPGVRLVELLGRGGFADVWKASTDAGPVALKFMAGCDAATSVREVRAVQNISRLSHPHLLRIDKVSTAPGFIIVSMELADGSMLDVLDACWAEYRSGIPPLLLLDFSQQIAAALDHLNARKHAADGKKVGYQHCDIKPSNILVIGESAKLADFGLATATTGALTPYTRSGTLDFVAPEVHRGMLADTSDQYSLAVTYFYLRTGRLPFPAPPATFTRSYSYARPAPDLSLIPRRERVALERALDVEPAKRWPTCARLVEELRLSVQRETESSAVSTLSAVAYTSQSA